MRFETNVAVQPHDFTAIGSQRQMQTRAIEDQTALGFLTNNLLSIQTAIDEIMYTAYRLPEFISINTSIPLGSSEYGVIVRDRVGRARRVSSPGYDAPSATISQGLVSRPLHYYGLDAEWSVQELRGAQMAGRALDTDSVEAAVMGSLEAMEAVAFTGDGYDNATGLVNQPTTGDGAVRSVTAPNTFTSATAEQIRTMITGEISKVIENSAETLGRNINMGMTVYLPGTQYDLLTSRYLGDNAERTVMRGLREDNPWTHFTSQNGGAGSPLMIMRLLELDCGPQPRLRRRQDDYHAQAPAHLRNGRVHHAPCAADHGRRPGHQGAGGKRVQRTVGQAPAGRILHEQRIGSGIWWEDQTIPPFVPAFTGYVPVGRMTCLCGVKSCGRTPETSASVRRRGQAAFRTTTPSGS